MAACNLELKDNAPKDRSNSAPCVRPGSFVARQPWFYRAGALLGGGLYRVVALLGQGAFGCVVRAEVTAPAPAGHHYPDVAIKIGGLGTVDSKAAFREWRFLQEIGATRPTCPAFFPRAFGSFLQQGHSCLVMELLSSDLRAYQCTLPHRIVPLRVVLTVGVHLLAALSHLATKGIIHGDVKLENVGFTDGPQSRVCLLDFNTSQRASSTTPPRCYAQSRWYRAPEVVLRMPYGPNVDLWSAWCLLFELASGYTLFAGADEHEMLQRYCTLLGRPAVAFLQRSRADCLRRHFCVTPTGHLDLLHTAFPSARMIGDLKEPDIKARLYRRFRAVGITPSEAELDRWDAFVDLLAGLLTWSPDARLTTTGALAHRFFDPATHHHAPQAAPVLSSSAPPSTGTPALSPCPSQQPSASPVSTTSSTDQASRTMRSIACFAM
jgi:serine/threonine protein kinase